MKTSEKLAVAEACIKALAEGNEVVLLAVPNRRGAKHIKLAADGPRGAVVGADGVNTLAFFVVAEVQQWLAKSV